ncbi:hypothetical protein ES706_05228 [subsurface metagenome]
MRRALIFSAFLVVFLTNGLWAKGPGTSGAIILDQPVGARASGMAEAYTAIEGEISVLHYNPAGLISLPNRQASFSYQRGLADDSFMSLLYGQPTRLGVLAGAFFYYTAGEIELIDLDGNEWTAKAEQDFVALIGFARQFLENWPMGVNLKIISSRVVEAKSATALAVDLGGLYYPPLEGLTIGLAIRNLGTRLKFIDKGDSLPLKICAGGAYKKSFGSQKVLLSIDFPFLVYEERLTPAAGLEFDWREMIQGRIGYKFNSDDTGLALGIGFTYQSYFINYAFGLANKLKNPHRASLGVRF